jgi:predicted RNA-binding protein with PIN domain
LNIKKELDGEIAKIRALLGTAAGNPFIENLQIRINSAATLEALSRLQHLLMELEQNGIVDSADLKNLYMIYNQRMNLLYEKYGYAPEKPRDGAGPGWSIERALFERQGIHLIVDGHNVLFGLPDLFRDFYEDGIPSSQAREKLLGLVDDILKDSPSCASVFFDGTVASERSFSRNVKEIYSGGGDPQVRNRADRAILDYLMVALGGEKQMPVIVVSNDLELQNLVLEKGAKVMPLMQFYAMISEFHAEHP